MKMLPRIIAIFLVGMMFAAVSLLIYFLYFEEPWLSYGNIPFPILKTPVHFGEVAPMTVVRCNSSDRPHTYTLSYSIENLDTGHFTAVPPVIVMAEPGCHAATSLANVLPESSPEVPPGHYRTVGLSEVNGTLKTFEVEWYSQPFEVITAEPGTP